VILATQAQIEALARLRNDPDFQKVVQMIEAEHAKSIADLLADMHTVSVHKNQGRALGFADLMQTIKSAATVLAKR
jgi:hypothetical protein